MIHEANELKKHLQSIAWMLGILDENEKSCCGITFAQCHALVEIGTCGELSLNDLADKLNLDKSTLSRTVNHLVTQGFCVREECPEDRRYVTIKLTPTGTGMFDKVKKGMDRYFEDIYNALPEAKRKQVLESAGLLLDAVKKTGCCC